MVELLPREAGLTFAWKASVGADKLVASCDAESGTCERLTPYKGEKIACNDDTGNDELHRVPFRATNKCVRIQ